jgi:hypothetical protein
MMMTHYLIAWIPMVFIAIFNAFIREYTYGKFLSEIHSHQISSFTAVILLGLFIGGITYVYPLESTLQALTIGLIWLVLTIAFEFLFGHYVAGHSWIKLLEDYNVLAGRLWVIVLVWVTLAPITFYHLWR